jgi:hypothetical protein
MKRVTEHGLQFTERREETDATEASARKAT